MSRTLGLYPRFLFFGHAFAALCLLCLVGLPALAQTNAPAGNDPFPKLSAADLIKILSTSDDKALCAQAAQALGDRNLAGKVKLSEQEAKALHAVVTAYVLKARSPADMKEADRQIQRLWHLAGPALLDALDNLETYSFAARSLSIMKTEAVAKLLVEKARSNTDANRKGLLRFALQSLKDRRVPNVEGRTPISQTESDRINTELITPAMEEMQ